jgi:RNA polymerase sigma factor (sigma-70 family)
MHSMVGVQSTTSYILRPIICSCQNERREQTPPPTCCSLPDHQAPLVLQRCKKKIVPSVTFPFPQTGNRQTPHTLDQFSTIITSVRDRLYRLALRVVNDPDEAEDVVQDVLIKSWGKRDEIVRLDNPPAWLLRMTKHQAIDRLRSAKVRSAREKEAAAPDFDARTPYRLTAANDALRHIDRLLLQLPPDQRMVLHLREVEGMEYLEIADATDLSVDQVKVYLHRGRAKLRKLLTRERIER